MSDRGSTSVLNLREFMTISQHVTKMLPNSEHNLHNDFKAGGQTNLGGTASGQTLSLSEGWRSVPPEASLPMRRHARIAITRHF
jgi:hypothetical protein